jgi:folate-binding protein YgfZ
MDHRHAAVCCLDDLGLLSFRGPDTRKFLQGQLSNDIGRLRPGTLLRAGLHSPQGRTLAVLALAAGPIGAAAGAATPADPQDAQEVLAVLPRELLAATVATLRRYILRAKVSISDETDSHRLYGVVPAAAPAAAPGAGCYAYGGQRVLVIAHGADSAPPGTALTRAHWRALDIAAGLPQLYAATSGQFVAQMLNLDRIDAVAFDKGCYTGQEVIARAHYRGRVKRRMQRFVSHQPLHLAPGDAGQFIDARTFRVIEALERDDGRCEFLAVAALPGAAEAEPDVPAASAAQPHAGDAAPNARPISAEPLPLPYPLEG